MQCLSGNGHLSRTLDYVYLKRESRRFLHFPFYRTAIVAVVKCDSVIPNGMCTLGSI